jgi:hypothetical protein
MESRSQESQSQSPSQREVSFMLDAATINGRQADGIRLEHAPDGSEGGRGPVLTGETDDQGRFQMQFHDREAEWLQQSAVSICIESSSPIGAAQNLQQRATSKCAYPQDTWQLDRPR